MSSGISVSRDSPNECCWSDDVVSDNPMPSDAMDQISMHRNPSDASMAFPNRQRSKSQVKVSLLGPAVFFTTPADLFHSSRRLTLSIRTNTEHKVSVESIHYDLTPLHYSRTLRDKVAGASTRPYVKKTKTRTKSQSRPVRPTRPMPTPVS